MMKKIILFTCLILLYFTLSYGTVKYDSASSTSLKITVTPSLTNILPTTTPYITITPTATPVITTPAGTDSTIAVSEMISPTEPPIQFEYFTHSVESDNENGLATAYTKIEVYHGIHNGLDEIIDKITIKNGDCSYDINNLIGYYSGMKWSKDGTKLVVSYYGRTWSNFSIFNVSSTVPAYSELSFDTIKNYFEGIGTVFEFKEQEDRPDPQITFQEWSDDSKSIKIKYSIIDTQFLTQSGTFWYDLDTRKMRDLEQKPPYEDG